MLTLVAFRPANIYGAASTKVTSTPLSLRFSAISTPINPPPITTAYVISCLSTYSLILSVSRIFLNAKILLFSIPAIGGLMAFAPGDNTR